MHKKTLGSTNVVTMRFLTSYISDSSFSLDPLGLGVTTLTK